MGKPSMTSAEETSTLRDQHTPTLTDSSLKLSPPLLPPSDSMEPLTLISLNSRLTWSHIQESISCFPHMPQSSLPRRPITSNSPLPRSPTLLSSQHPSWPSVTQDTESTWHVASCTEVTSSQRMSTPPLPPSRPREPFNSLTGAQLVSSVVSTINHQLLFQVVISPRS